MTFGHICRQRGSALPCGGCGSPCAALIGDECDPLEFVGDGGVGSRCGRRQVPRSFVCIDGDGCQRGVCLAHCNGTDGVVDGRAHQWMDQFDRLG